MPIKVPGLAIYRGYLTQDRLMFPVWQHRTLNLHGDVQGREVPTPYRRYYPDETEPTSKNPRKDSQLSLTKPVRQTSRQKKKCVICTDNRSFSRFPSDPPTARCAHKADVYRSCLRKWIETTFADKVSDEINCPICSEHMECEDVRKFAPSYSASTRGSAPKLRWKLYLGSIGVLRGDVSLVRRWIQVLISSAA